MIGQILEYNMVAKFLFIIQSVNPPPCAHTIIPIAHYSTLQPSAACSQPSSAHPVHTLQQPLHIQYTLQQIFSAHCIYYPVHTAANLQCTLQQIFSAHCSYNIWCQYHRVHITSSAPLNHHRVSLYHYCPTSRTVSRH